MAGFAGSGKASQQVGAARGHFVKFHIQARARGRGGEKIRNPMFARARIVCRQKGRIHAWQCDEFAKEFCSPTHAGFREFVLPEFPRQAAVHLPARRRKHAVTARSLLVSEVSVE